VDPYGCAARHYLTKSIFGTSSTSDETLLSATPGNTNGVPLYQQQPDKLLLGTVLRYGGPMQPPLSRNNSGCQNAGRAARLGTSDGSQSDRSAYNTSGGISMPASVAAGRLRRTAQHPHERIYPPSITRATKPGRFCGCIRGQPEIAGGQPILRDHSST
jgi:hypothetical protein